MLTIPPKYSSGRRPELRTRAPRTAAVAATVLHRPFLPWQHTAAALIGEHTRGRRVHQLVVVTIQRQAGKTTLLFGDAVERCMTTPGYRVFYTAQTGQYAREKWQEVAEQLTGPASPIRRYVRARYTNGAERLVFTRTGAQIRPFPPTPDAMHSFQSDLIVIDEAWKFSADQGSALLQGASPTRATRPGAQIVIVSTAGTAASTFLRPMVDRGRDGDPSLAYLEYGLPDGADPLDVDLICHHHPAVDDLGLGLIERQFLVDELSTFASRPAEYARAYGNVWSTVAERIIDPQVWSAAVTAQLLPPGPVTFAGAVALDRSRAAIVAVSGGVVEVVDSRPGVDWIAARMLQLADRDDAAAIGVLRFGPDGALADALELGGVTVHPMSMTDYAIACARTLDDLQTRRLRYRLHPALDAAVDAAADRYVGDGWVWAPRRAAAPIPELVAMTVGHWVDTHRPIRKKAAAHT